MQKLNAVMLSALIVAGLALQALAQEIDVIELEPGIKLKKKVQKLKQKDPKKSAVRWLTTDDNKKKVEIEFDDFQGKQKVIDLGNGSKAIIRIETDGNEVERDVVLKRMGDAGQWLTLLEDDDEHQGVFKLKKSDGKKPNGVFQWNTEMDEDDFEAFELNEDMLSSLPLLMEGDFQGLIREHLDEDMLKGALHGLQSQLGDLEIKVDGSPFGLHEMISPDGLNLERLHKAHNIDIEMGGRDIHIPLEHGRRALRLLRTHIGQHKAKSKSTCEPCPKCGCDCKSKKKSRVTYGWSTTPPKKGHATYQWSTKAPKKSKKAYSFVTPHKKDRVFALKAPKAPKAPRATWVETKKSDSCCECPFLKRKAAKIKKAHKGIFKAMPKAKKGGGVYFMDTTLPKAKKKSGKGSFYFKDATPKKKKAKVKRYFKSDNKGQTMLLTPHSSKSKARIVAPKSGKGSFAILDATKPHGKAPKALLRRLQVEDDNDDDDDDLEEELEELENEIRELKKQLRRLKRRI